MEEGLIFPQPLNLDSRSTLREGYLNVHYPGFVEWLRVKYPFCESLDELLYNYVNSPHVSSRPLCPVCGKSVDFCNFTKGYSKYCSSKCSGQSESVKSKCKQTCLERYGAKNYAQSQEYQSRHDEIRNKVKQTCLEKYRAECYTQSNEGRSKLSELQGSNEIRSKIKQTCLERYGSKNYTQSQDYQSRHDEIQSKINNTKCSNGTFNTSKIEEEFASYLDQNHIIYKRQYKSDPYPFNWDFYLPGYELYIEIQDSWTHGHHPYNIELDKETLNKWRLKGSKYYNNAIKVWTKKDPLKRETAKLNNLNYLEIFSNNIDEVIKQYESTKTRRIKHQQKEV